MAEKFDAKKVKKTATTGAAVSGAIERGQSDNPHLQVTAGPEEQAQRAAEMETQGRKGCKSPRLNLRMTPENYEFVSIMAKLSGRSNAQFVNFLVEEYKDQHPDLYEKAKEIMRDAGMEDEQ